MVKIGPATIMVGNLAATLEGEHAISPERQVYIHNSQWGAGVTAFLKDVVDDIDEFYNYLTGKGVAIAEPLHTTSYGWKMFGVADPDGYVIMFANEIP